MKSKASEGIELLRYRLGSWHGICYYLGLSFEAQDFAEVCSPGRRQNDPTIQSRCSPWL